MTTIRLKCAFALILIGIASIGPIPIASTLGAFVALFRPCWFKTLVDNIYRNSRQNPTSPDNSGASDGNPGRKNTASAAARLQLLSVMIIFMLLDIGPMPTVSLIALFIVIFRPQWFLTLMKRVYGEQ